MRRIAKSSEATRDEWRAWIDWLNGWRHILYMRGYRSYSSDIANKYPAACHYERGWCIEDFANLIEGEILANCEQCDI